MSVKYLDIHKALHSDQESVTIEGVKKTILTSRNNKRFVTIGIDTFIQADKKKSRYISTKFKDAKSITWVMRPGQRTWGLIVDGKIIKP